MNGRRRRVLSKYCLWFFWEHDSGVLHCCFLVGTYAEIIIHHYLQLPLREKNTKCYIHSCFLGVSIVYSILFSEKIMAFILFLYIILVRRYLQKFRVLEIQSIRKKYTYFIIHICVFIRKSDVLYAIIDQHNPHVWTSSVNV